MRAWRWACALRPLCAAPLPSHVQDFLRATMGCPEFQRYGMTENCAQGTIAMADDWRGGHVLSLIHISEPTRPERIAVAVVRV